MKSLHNKQFPNESNESKEYRKARNELLQAEIELRRQTEEVAKKRRELPLGGKVTEDYAFTASDGKKVKLSQLFDKGKDTLVVYSMMFDTTWDEPCPMCNSIVDGLNGNARQITLKINLAVVGKAPIEKLNAYANKTGWHHVRIVSSHHNTYNADYFGEVNKEQQPMVNVFVKKKDGIYHTWGSELTLVPPEKGQDHRAIDPIWPLWNLLDLTPLGRENWYPKVTV